LSDTFLIGVGLMLALVVVVGFLFPEQIATEPPLALEAASPGRVEAGPPAEDQPASPPAAAADTPGAVIEPTGRIPNEVDGIVRLGEYAHRTDAGGFEVHWSNDLNYLRIGIVSPGTGYLAIGFDPDYRMRGADFVLAAVEDGRLLIRDDYGDGAVSHAADELLGGTDDILEAAGREEGGRTTVEFVIPLVTRDRYDKTLVPGETYSILVAYHETNDSFAVRHSRRGSGTIRLDAAR